MKIILFLLSMILSIYGQTTLPYSVTIKANSCNIWKKTGSWIYGDDMQSVEWEQRCQSASPSDLKFKNTDGTNIGRTDDKYFSINVQIRLRNKDNKIIARFEEQIWKSLTKIGTVYTIKDGDGNILGKSNKLELFDTVFTIYDNDDNIIATAEQKILNKLQQSICGDGSWKISFTDVDTFLNMPENRWIIASMITVKAVRDTDRDSEGNVQNSNCQSLYYFLIIGLPIIFVFTLVAIIFLIYKFGCYAPCCDN